MRTSRLMAHLTGLALTGSVLACLADDQIKLPSGTMVDRATFEIRPRWRSAFPEDHQFYIEKTAAGGLQGVYGRDGGKIDGSVATLHENGKLKMLANYPHSVRQGAMRFWDESQKIVLYSQYKDGKKHGMTCLFSGGAVWLIQVCKAGEVDEEVLLAANGKVIEDSEQLEAAHKGLASVEAEVKEIEQGIRKNLHQWFEETDKRIKEQNLKAIRPIQKAELAASKQRKVQEAADAVAGAHRRPYSRVGGMSRAVAADAKDNRKVAIKAAGAREIEAKSALQKRDASISAEIQREYEFAIQALEDSLPRARSERTVPIGRVRIVNRGSGLVIGVLGKTVRETGAKIVQWATLGNEGENSQWQIEPAGQSRSSYTIRNQTSGKYLAIAQRSKERDILVQQSPYSENDFIFWRIEPVSDGFWRIINQGSGLCLQVLGTDRGLTVRQSSAQDGAREQEWQLAPAPRSVRR